MGNVSVELGEKQVKYLIDYHDRQFKENEIAGRVSEQTLEYLTVKALEELLILRSNKNG